MAFKIIYEQPKTQNGNANFWKLKITANTFWGPISDRFENSAESEIFSAFKYSYKA